MNDDGFDSAAAMRASFTKAASMKGASATSTDGASPITKAKSMWGKVRNAKRAMGVTRSLHRGIKRRAAFLNLLLAKGDLLREALRTETGARTDAHKKVLSELLRGFRFMSSIDPILRPSFANPEILSLVEVKEGEFIVRKGDPALCVLVVSGKVVVGGIGTAGGAGGDGSAGRGGAGRGHKPTNGIRPGSLGSQRSKDMARAELQGLSIGYTRENSCILCNQPSSRPDRGPIQPAFIPVYHHPAVNVYELSSLAHPTVLCRLAGISLPGPPYG